MNEIVTSYNIVVTMPDVCGAAAPEANWTGNEKSSVRRGIKQSDLKARVKYYFRIEFLRHADCRIDDVVSRGENKFQSCGEYHAGRIGIVVYSHVISKENALESIVIFF